MNIWLRNLWVIFVLVLFLISVSSTIWLYYQKQEISYQFEKAQKDWIKQRKDLIKELNNAKENLNELKAELSSLQEKFTRTTNNLNSLKQKYERLNKVTQEQKVKLSNLREELRLKLEKISQLEKKNQAYREQLKELKVERLSSPSIEENELPDHFSTKLVNWEQEKEVLKRKLISLSNKLKRADVKKKDIINEINEVNKLLEKRIIEITNFRNSLEVLMRKSKKLAMEKAFNTVSTVELPPIVIHKGDDEEYTESQDLKFTKYENKSTFSSSKKDISKGKILVVNHSEDFVVINLGRKDGVSEGMLFAVYRGEERVGKVKVIEVRKRLSAANIEQVAYGEIITVNDSIRLIE